MVDSSAFDPDVVGNGKKQCHGQLHGNNQGNLKIEKTVERTCLQKEIRQLFIVWKWNGDE